MKISTLLAPNEFLTDTYSTCSKLKAFRTYLKRYSPAKAFEKEPPLSINLADLHGFAEWLKCCGLVSGKYYVNTVLIFLEEKGVFFPSTAARTRLFKAADTPALPRQAVPLFHPPSAWGSSANMVAFFLLSGLRPIAISKSVSKGSGIYDPANNELIAYKFTVKGDKGLKHRSVVIPCVCDFEILVPVEKRICFHCHGLPHFPVRLPGISLLFSSVSSEYSGYAGRRALAINLHRIMGPDGWEPARVRLNKQLGWSENSKMFFRYCANGEQTPSFPGIKGLLHYFETGKIRFKLKDYPVPQ